MFFFKILFYFKELRLLTVHHGRGLGRMTTVSHSQRKALTYHQNIGKDMYAYVLYTGIKCLSLYHFIPI